MKTKIYTSLFAGALFGVSSYIILLFIEPDIALAFAILSGVLFCIVLLIVLIIEDRLMDKKYEKFEKSINSEIFYKANGNFNTADGVINGNIYFCEQGIVIVSLIKKPYAVEEILLPNIERYEFNDIHMNIYTKDWKKYYITVPDANNILQVLKDKKWIE